MENQKLNPSALLKAKTGMRKKREPKTYKLSIRFTVAQIAAINLAAKSMGQNTASYCRQIILKRKVKDLSPETREYRNNLIRMGNNLNQIARKLNAHGVDETTMSELGMILNYIRELKRVVSSNLALEAGIKTAVSLLCKKRKRK